MNDVEFHSMSDLAHMPITQWPSIESYASFKKYWFAAIKDLEDRIIHTDGRVAPGFAQRSKNRFEDLLKALDRARAQR